ncbi:hypothetical protein Ancab_026099 [Ancistrocladus abbreviatus]
MNSHQCSVGAPTLKPKRCGSSVVQTINAPLEQVWSLVQRFDQPQAYKIFVKSCTMLHSGDDGIGGGGGDVGSIREVRLVSGLPATTSVERLDRLDHELHVMMISIIGGDHKLANYQSTTRLDEAEGGKKTVVTESYAVDVPMDSNKEDTCLFVDTVIGFNLKSLAAVAETIDAAVYCS